MTLGGGGLDIPGGAVELTVLGPPYPLRGTRSDPNNNSLVLLATVAGVRILLAGDAETEEQRACSTGRRRAGCGPTC